MNEKRGGVFLGIETSGQQTALALVQDEQTLGTVREITAARHNETIFDLLDRVFTEAKVEPGQLAGVGVSIGPGMFSALRVGLSVAKGLALAHGVAIKGVNTLDALALTAYRSRLEFNRDLPVLPIIDARKGEVYCVLYQNAERVSGYRVISPMELSTLPMPVVFCGPGVEPYRSIIDSIFGSRATFLPLDYPPAEIIAAEARSAIAAGNADDIESLSPLYLRRTDAELYRERTQGQARPMSSDAECGPEKGTADERESRGREPQVNASERKRKPVESVESVDRNPDGTTSERK